MGIKGTKRGAVWYATGTVNGIRVRRSLETRDERTAKIACRAIEREIWQRDPDQKPRLTFEEAALNYMRADGCKRFLAPLILHFRGRDIRDITPQDIQDAAPVIHPHATPATWNRQVITPAQAVINHAGSRQRPQMAELRVERFAVARPKPRTAGSWGWLTPFMAAADPEIAALAHFMFTTGARIGESLKLDWDNVDLDARTAWLSDTKTEPRLCHLTERMADQLRTLDRDGPRVFRWKSKRYVYGKWRAACACAGIEYLTPHRAGRAGFATEMRTRHHLDSRTTARLGGWQSPRMVDEIYAEVEGERAIIDAVFGKSG